MVYMVSPWSRDLENWLVAVVDTVTVAVVAVDSVLSFYQDQGSGKQVGYCCAVVDIVTVAEVAVESVLSFFQDQGSRKKVGCCC